MRAIFLIPIFAAAGCATSHATQEANVADDRGLSQFLRSNDVSQVTISPAGTYLAALSNASGETHVAFFRTADLKPVGGFKVGGINIFSRMEWASETRLVAQLAQNDGPLSLPKDYGEIYAVNYDGTNENLIFGYRSGDVRTGSNISTHDRIRAWGTIIGRVRGDEQKVLVMARHWSDGRGPGAVEAFSVDAVSGRRQKVAAGPGDVQAYYYDEARVIRLALSLSRNAELEAYWFDQEWKRLDKVAPLRASAKPLGFSASARSLYVVDEDAEGPALFEVKLDTGERKMLVREPGVEPSDVLFDAKTGTPVAVEFVPDTPKWKILNRDHPLAKILKAAFEKLDTPPDIVSMTEDQKQAVVFNASDRGPGIFSLVREDGFVQPLLQMREGGKLVAVTKPFAVKTSDGFIVRGYLTLPIQAKEGTPLPMVVLPHGGPHGVRDYAYDDEAQLFAAFGFASLRVNYRGSGGYGEGFIEAGYRHWGDRVQDDIIEATRWAIGEKIADPKRIAIFGASFGGYSAVQSTIRAPEMFRCAVGYAGIYDLELLYDEGDIQQTERGVAAMDKFVGQNPEELAKFSPAKNAAKIPVPVLLLHGEDDERAPIVHAKTLCEAMRAEKKSCEELYFAHERHGFFDLENRVSAYKRALEFIEQHTK